MLTNTVNNSLGLDIYFPFLDLIKATNLAAPYGEIVVSGFAFDYTNILLRLSNPEQREEVRNRLAAYSGLSSEYNLDRSSD